MLSPSDYMDLSDEELDEVRRNVLIEQERRQRIARIPTEIASMAASFIADGGSQEDLEAAIRQQEEAAKQAALETSTE